MTANLLLQLSRPARMRSLVDALLIGLPLPLLVAALVWRWHSVLAASLIALAALLSLAAFAWWRTRRFDKPWLIRRLDAQRADMENSAELLFADEARLNPVQQLQRARLQRRLATGVAADLRLAWSWPRIAVAWIIGALGIATVQYWPTETITPTGLAPSVENVSAAPGVPRLVAQRLRIAPPAYTGLPTRDEASLDAKAPQGSQLQWTLQFQPQPAAAGLVFLDGERLALSRDGDYWIASAKLDKSRLYRVQPQGGRTTPAARLHRLDAVADAPPQIKILQPDRSLSLVTPGQRAWALRFEAEDDHGVASVAQLRLTLAQGEGENISFRERTLRLNGSGTRTKKRFAMQVDLGALGFAVGDDLVAQLSVDDSRAPRAQTARSSSLILRWPSDLGNQGTGLEGMVKTTLPAYFRSQRQIIIDAEALLKKKRKLKADDYLARSDAIGVDQRLLRLRYGQFLGEEAEGAPLLPTNDAEDEKAATDAHAHRLPPPQLATPHVARLQGLAIALGHADDANQNGIQESASAEPGAAAQDPGHAHDHGQASSRAPSFGEERDVLQQFGHTHDSAEAATLLDPGTRTTLRKALDEMWQSELHLRQGQPDRALPYAYRALTFIKQVQQSTRIYLAKVGPELPPIDESRRMSGKREGLARRELALPAADPTDAVPAQLWRALAPTPGATAAQSDPPLDSLERWLRANEARVPDPLAWAGAIDALRREPACLSCRDALRALLWTALPRPAAQVPRRDAGDARGQRYLDALRQEPAP